MADAKATIAGRYEVLRQLGSGGMGTVVLAEDRKLRRQVAIKRVHATGGEEAQRRLRREAKLGASLTHPGLVTVFDTLMEDGNLVIVMEHVPGETLADRLDRGALEPAEALTILRLVAAALDHAHAHGIIHRDVKPANVLLGERGAVKLADLGVAVADDVSRITSDGAMVGSLPYMAPEQLEPGRVEPPADVFALAAVAFEALTGRRARTGPTPLAIVRAALDGPVPTAPELPAGAAAALAAGMARDPARRPVTAGRFVDELEAGLATAPRQDTAPTRERTAASVLRPRPPEPPPAAPAHGRRGPIAAAALGAIAVVVGAVLLLTGGADDGGSPSVAGKATATATTKAKATTSSAPAAPATAAAVAAGDDPSTPTGAVRAFYERAAHDDFAGAYALAGPQFRKAFGGSQAGLEGTLGTLTSIRFKQLRTEGKANGGTTVRVETVARHTDHTDHCTGTLLAVPDGAGGYRVDPAGLSCAPA